MLLRTPSLSDPPTNGLVNSEDHVSRDTFATPARSPAPMSARQGFISKSGALTTGVLRSEQNAVANGGDPAPHMCPEMTAPAGARGHCMTLY